MWKSAIRYRAIVEDQTEQICRFLPDGTLTFVNGAYCRYFNLKREELLGRSFLSLVPDEERDIVKAHLSRLDRDNPTGIIEHRVMNSSGYIQWQQQTARAIFNKEGRIVEFQSVGRDITEARWMFEALKKAYIELEEQIEERTVELCSANARLKDEIEQRSRAEEQLRESEKRYHDLVNFLPQPVFEIDEKGFLAFANRAAFNAFGYTAEDMEKGLNIRGLIAPEDRERVMQNIGRLFEGEDHSDNEYTALRKDGLRIPVIAYVSRILRADRTVGLRGIAIDVAKSKQAQEALRESEKRYRRIVETAQEGIWLVDSQTRTTYVNQRMADMFGYTIEEMLGRSIHDFMDEESSTQAGINFSRQIQGIKEHRDFLFKRKDGSKLWATLSTRPIFDDDRQFVGALCMVCDISDRKMAEERIIASLKEKEVLLREIHHRVKNNMQIVSSLLSLQSAHMTGKDPSRVFQDCHNRIQSMVLIHETLYRSENLADIDFVEYLRKLVRNLSRSYTDCCGNAGIVVEGNDIFLDINRAIPCGLIVNELVSNAFKYAFQGGPQGEIRVGIESIDNRFRLIVKDNGFGFPETTDWRNTNTLGLQLVTMLVEQLGGTIECNNTNGTEFKICF
jgi:PAS domain S-box-containing protein